MSTESERRAGGIESKGGGFDGGSNGESQGGGSSASLIGGLRGGGSSGESRSAGLSGDPDGGSSVKSSGGSSAGLSDKSSANNNAGTSYNKSSDRRPTARDSANADYINSLKMPYDNQRVFALEYNKELKQEDDEYDARKQFDGGEEFKANFKRMTAEDIWGPPEEVIKGTNDSKGASNSISSNGDGKLKESGLSEDKKDIKNIKRRDNGSSDVFNPLNLLIVFSLLLIQ